jgi:hypothetical protein
MVILIGEKYMKKALFTALLASTTLFAEPSLELSLPPLDLNLPITPLIPEEISIAKQGFFYVRFAAAESDLIRMSAIVPGLGIGYRRLSGTGAADILFSGLGRAEHKSGKFFWVAPKASYISYVHPDATATTYFGGGLAWGGIVSKDQSFIGLIPSATFGYEFARKSTVLGFAEVNLNQPAISVFRKGEFPGPVVECTMGIGF